MVTNMTEVKKIHVRGLIGKQINLTWEKNVLLLDVVNDFLLPFKLKNKSAGEYIGLGKHTESILEARIGGCDVKIQQTTDYPDSGDVKICLSSSEPTEFVLRIRKPAWVQKFDVSVNNDAISITENSGLIRLKGLWKTGDVIELKMDTPFHQIKGFRDQNGRVAVMRGPVVFCLNPSLNIEVEGKNLKGITIDPSTFSFSKVENAPARRSVLCTVKAGLCEDDLNGGDSFDLKLTPFPDQGGQATYFQTKDISLTCEDELLNGFCGLDQK